MDADLAEELEDMKDEDIEEMTTMQAGNSADMRINEITNI